MSYSFRKFKPDTDVLKPAGYPAVAETLDQKRQECSKKRSAADEEGHVAGLGICQCSILRKEIERTAGDAEEHEDGLVEEGLAEELHRLASAVFASVIQADCPDTDIGKHEADSEYLGRQQSCGYQHLGTYEGNAPDGDDQKCEAMVGYEGSVHSSDYIRPQI